MHPVQRIPDLCCADNGEPSMVATSTPDLAAEMGPEGFQCGTGGLRLAVTPGSGVELDGNATHDAGVVDFGEANLRLMNPHVAEEDTTKTPDLPAEESAPPGEFEARSEGDMPGSPGQPCEREITQPDPRPRPGRGPAKPKAMKAKPASSRAQGGKPSVGKKAGAVEGTNDRPSPQGTGSVLADELVREIKEQQAAQDRHEGSVVAVSIRIGVNLALLKAESKRAWGKRLLELGYSARVASRLLKLGVEWGGEIGRIGPDLLPKLPNDLNKLEWLCRLDAGRLGRLLARIDARKAGRKQIVAEVKDALGETPAPKAADNALGGSIDRMFDRLAKTVERLQGEAATAGQATDVIQALSAGFSRILGRLEPAGGEPPIV